MCSREGNITDDDKMFDVLFKTKETEQLEHRTLG